tara:strand:+ start:419 stop:661 length:243 start_codon:yes stop_codon:yes gene_type:complete
MTKKIDESKIKVIDADQAFKEGIAKGLKPEGKMYMYTKDGKHFFKDKETRKYQSFKKGGEITSEYRGGGAVNLGNYKGQF